MDDLVKQSLTATYDSRETGPRYWVTTWLGDKVTEWQKPLEDPFVRHTVTITWRGLLYALLRRKLSVTVLIGADTELMDDVLELDSNQLVPGRTRQAEFRGEMNEALRRFAVDRELEEMAGGQV